MKRTRKTKQKDIIDEEIQEFETFFTADELYSRVNKVHSRIGIATVYRYLRDNSCDGNLHVYNCERRAIYSMNDNSHCHFRCTKCGRKYHIQVRKIDFVKQGVKGKICHFQLDVYGICENCMSMSLPQESGMGCESPSMSRRF
jgi:Fur family ferric uptake transcriptional regulator